MSPKTVNFVKRSLSFMVVLVAFAVVSPAFAQNPETGGGVDTCVNSPENPTAILALVGSAGGMLVAVRTRLRRK